jgi:hypothetical protein
MIASQLPGDHALKARVLAALAAAHRALQEPPAFERGALERGLDACRAAAAARSDDWRSGGPMQDWAVYFRMRLAELDVRDGNPAAAAAALEDAVTRGGASAAPGAGAAGTPGGAAATAPSRHFPRFVEPRHRIPALLFRIQLAMARGDVDDARRGAEAAAELFAKLDAPDAMPPEDEREQAALTYSKLHFNVLQIMMYVRMGELETLLSQGAAADDPEGAAAGGGAGAAAASAVAFMQELLDQTGDAAEPYDWLPRAAMAAVVHLLAVAVHRAGGSSQAREAARHADLGLAALAPALAALGCADAADAARAAAAGRPLAAPLVNEHGIDRRDRSRAALLLSLRVLLGEARVQSRLLATDLAGARQEAAAQMLLAERFPTLLARLLPTVHLQAGLYAQAVGVWPAADAHFAAAVAGGGGGAGADRPTAVAAAAYRALVGLAAAPGPEAVARGASAMGPLYASAVGGGGAGGAFGGERPGDLTADALAAAPGLPGNAERGAAHVAVALLRLRAGDAAAAKQRLQRAMRLAHGRLRSQQLLSQVLHALAPLLADGGGGGGGGGADGGAGAGSQGGGAPAAAAAAPGHNDYSGAETMLASTSTICRNSNDVEGQVAALELLDQLFGRMSAAAGGGPLGGELARKAAQNSNYLAKKRAQLSERLAAAEGSNPAEHRAVLAWGLGS